jgi:hypothetical protein
VSTNEQAGPSMSRSDNPCTRMSWCSRWDDEAARTALVDELDNDALGELEVLENRTPSTEVAQAVGLLATVAGQLARLCVSLQTKFHPRAAGYSSSHGRLQALAILGGE